MLSFVSYHGECLGVVYRLGLLEQMQRAQDLPNAHSEGDSASTLEGRIAVEELADRPYAVLLQLLLHPDERTLYEGEGTTAVELEVGLEVSPE